MIRNVCAMQIENNCSNIVITIGIHLYEERIAKLFNRGITYVFIQAMQSHIIFL